MPKENSAVEEEKLLEFVMAGRTDVGCERDNNEDCFYLEENAHAGWALVADGLGGHLGGDVASEFAAVALTEFVVDSNERDSAAHMDEKIMAEAFQATHAVVHAHGQKHSRVCGMGTTLTAVHIDRTTRRLVSGHIGDSRYYRWRDGALVQMTDDHTRAGRLLRADPDARVPWQAWHSLERALGPNQECEPEYLCHEVIPGDLLLLCSDGLDRVLKDYQITEILARDLPAPERYVDALVGDCLAGGAPDNVTVVVVMIR